MLAAALLLQAALFAPPLDAPLLVRTERVERGQNDRRFTLERLVRFAREEDGYRAEVRVLGVESDTAEPVAAMIEGGFAPLIGRTVVVHLDGRGQVRAIDDMAALWAQLCEAMGALAASRRSLAPAERAALAHRIAVPLAALPAERQRAMLGSLVTAIVLDGPVEPVGSFHPVRLPAASPFGTPATLEGARSTVAVPGGIETTTRAAADLSLPAEGQAPARSGRIDVERVLRADPETGMIALSTESTRTVADGRATQRVTTVRVTRAASDAWLKP